jgi:hypothetical protein
MKRRLPVIALSALALIAAASVLTRPTAPSKGGAGLLAGAQIDSDMLATLRRSCGDCHSEETRYPWYSYVAPVSWWLEYHVSQGRRHLNLSRWNEYPLPRKERRLSDIANQVKTREMPLRSYLLLHREAELSNADVDAIFRWTQAERARLIAESAAGNPQ